MRARRGSAWGATSSSAKRRGLSFSARELGGVPASGGVAVRCSSGAEVRAPARAGGALLVKSLRPLGVQPGAHARGRAARVREPARRRRRRGGGERDERRERIGFSLRWLERRNRSPISARWTWSRRPESRCRVRWWPCVFRRWADRRARSGAPAPRGDRRGRLVLRVFSGWSGGGFIQVSRRGRSRWSRGFREWTARVTSPRWGAGAPTPAPLCSRPRWGPPRARSTPTWRASTRRIRRVIPSARKPSSIIS